MLAALILILLVISFIFGIQDFGRYAGIANIIAGGLIAWHQYGTFDEKARFKNQVVGAAQVLVNKLKFDLEVTVRDYDRVKNAYDELIKYKFESYPTGQGLVEIIKFHEKVTQSLEQK